MSMRVLIANRGEIAVRVARTCRRLGIPTMAIYTDLDTDAPHVRAADEACAVPSYLDIEAVVERARQFGCTHVHPGYGFLSERAAFATALEAAGITLIGPSAAVMEQMGRKDAAREIAIAAGVPVVPQGEPTDGAAYPVLVKAAAGGGGKGMRIVRSAGEYDAALAAAKREARTAFGDDSILVEKYVERGRHIEVQVIGDGHGNVRHLFERDCSTQRRHQKVLEEAPAPTIPAETRQAVTDAAVALAAHVGYVNAGTVEFLLDDATGQAYFLEMNTRLQVEHPVTEAVVRIRGEAVDLVELQLRVAAGKALDFAQGEVALEGHAIEARIYAEDSFGGFLPQAGTTSIVRWPTGVRVDHALEPGQVVSTSYDPMLGKVIAHGPDRESARRALLTALDETAILGLTTNTGFLRALVAGQEFTDASIDTAWLDRSTVPEPEPDTSRTIAAWTQVLVDTMGPAEPFQGDGWRLGADPAPVVVELDERVTVDRHRGLVGDVPVSPFLAEQHVVVLSVDGRRERAVVDVTPHVVEVVHEGQRRVFERPDVFADHGPAAGDGTVLAPMPGTVLDVRVSEGQEVAEGDVLGAMEAMKMELSLTAPFAGTVAAVEAAAGEQVALGATLFVVEPTESGADQS
ncbi:MAG: biotin carboxylase N-terminal domain-containing protein [Nocardioides sp.]